MAPSSAAVVICGAGIAGVATAYHLAVRRGVRGVVLVDERPPLTLTSDKSAECYRNWWPGPGDAMVAVMNRSIDLLEELARESGNVFRMNRRGYLFATADPARVPQFSPGPRDGGERLRPGGRRRVRLAADRRRRDHGAVADPATLPVPHPGHARGLARPPLRLVQRAAARHVSPRAGARAWCRARRGSRRNDRHDRRTRARRARHRAGRWARARDGPRGHRRRALSPPGRPPARRRGADLLRAAREDRLERRAPRDAAGRAPHHLGRSDEHPVVTR